MSHRSDGAMKKSYTFRFRMSLVTIARRDGSAYGSGRSITAFTTLKIAVLAPMPSASVMRAVIANPGLLRRVRIP